MLSRSFVISSRLSLLDLCAEPLFLLAEFRRELCAEILGFEHLPNLELASFVRGIGTTLGPIDRLLQRRAFPEPEACDQLLGLSERTVDHRPLVSRESDPARPSNLGEALPRPASHQLSLVLR